MLSRLIRVKLSVCAVLVASLCLMTGCLGEPGKTTDNSEPIASISQSSSHSMFDKSNAESEFHQAGSMPRNGKAKVLALRVTFPEYDDDANQGFAEGDDLASLSDLIGGNSVSADGYPYDSLSAFYSRSSYGNLEISGDAFDYRADEPKDICAVHLEGMVLAALVHLEQQGVDLSSYDGNEDGIIDCVYIHAAGALPSWGEAWWSGAAYYFGDKMVGNVTFGSYVVLHRPSNAIGAARNMIHETGHALGLPDLYGNYEADSVSDDGSLLDSKSFGMMDSSTGDIDLYFKWCLGWLDDSQVVFVAPGETVEIDLVASGLPARDGNRLLVIGESGQFGKMYAVEYDRFLGNFNVMVGSEDSLSPLPDGFRIFAIDSTEQGGFVLKDNASQDSGSKLFEAVDIDVARPHAVYHGVPYAVDALYNCPLLLGQTTRLQGDRVGFDGNIEVSVLSCGDESGCLRIAATD